MKKTYKLRLYPTKDQEQLLLKHLEAYTFVYNDGLEKKLVVWEESGDNVGRLTLIKQLPKLKKENGFLYNVSSNCLQHAIFMLYYDFKWYLKGGVMPRREERFDFYHVNDNVYLKFGKLSLPKFREGIHFSCGNVIEGRIKSADIHLLDDKWFALLFMK